TFTPVLVILLIIASFLLGMLLTKVQYLEQNGGSLYQAGAGTQPAAAQQQAGAQAAQPGQKVNVAVGHLPLMGNKDAKVTVVEFADFQCPFCKQWFTEVESTFVNDYVKTGKVKFYFRHYPFLGQESTFAANASECANEQGRFWDFHDYLYQNQGQENSGTFAKDKLEADAATLGLNTAQFNSCLESDKYNSQVSADLADGQKAGVSGTPTVFVDGQPIVGAQPYSAFKAIVDQELAKK
ncbi:MAG TPA: DsbA family protein, partial [Patescibacteria group bacterium]|nr:DsbA family protein [Patescibacteria group bacterium]